MNWRLPDGLNKALANAKPGVEFGKYKRQLEEAEFDLKSLQTQAENTANALSQKLTTEGFDVMFEGIKPLSSQLGELEDAMYELALRGEQDSEVFRQLQADAVNMRRTIIEVDKSVDQLAENNGIAGVGEQVRGLATSLFSLDFTSATRQAQGLATSLQSISWGSAVSGIKNMTSAFANLGKALLTNPLFLLAAVIIGIGAAIYKLMKETGLLQVAMEALGKVFEWIMAPINLLINGLKTLTDNLGLTNNAQKELTASMAEQSAKRLDAYTKIYDNEQSLIEQNILDKQQELDAIKDTDEGALESRIRLQSEINKLNQDALENQDVLMQKQLKSAKANYNKLLAEYSGDVEKWQEDDYEGWKQADKNINDIIVNRQKNLSVISRQEITSQKEIDAIRDKATEAEKNRLKELAEAHKTYVLNRINAERQINDLALSALDDTLQSNIARERETYKRLRQDILRDETLLQKEKETILLLMEERFQENLRKLVRANVAETEKSLGFLFNKTKETNKEIIKDEREKNEEIESLLKIHSNRVSGIEQSESDKRKEEVRNYYNDLAKTIGESGYFKTLEEAVAFQAKMSAQMRKELDDIDKEDAFNNLNNGLKNFVDTLKSVSGENGSFVSDLTSNLYDGFVAMNALLDTEFKSTKEKVAAYVSTIGNVISSIISSISAETNRQLQVDVDNLTASTGERLTELDNQLMNQTINQEEYNKQKQLLEIETNKKENELRKKAFEENKKSQIANATVQMLQGAVSAFAQGVSTLPPPAGAIVGAAMAAATLAMGAANINRIKATQFQGSTGNAATSSIGDIATPSTDKPDSPTFTFLGNGNDANTSNLGGNQTVDITGKVIVSVTDINNGLTEVSTTDDYNSLGGG